MYEELIRRLLSLKEKGINPAGLIRLISNQSNIDGTDIEEFSKNAVGKAINGELSKFDQATILLTIGTCICQDTVV